MTGKELIYYILKNDLENEQIIKKGSFIGIIDEIQLAAKLGVGTATITAWYKMGMIDGLQIGDTLYFLETIKDPRKAA